MRCPCCVLRTTRRNKTHLLSDLHWFLGARIVIASTELAVFVSADGVEIARVSEHREMASAAPDIYHLLAVHLHLLGRLGALPPQRCTGAGECDAMAVAGAGELLHIAQALHLLSGGVALTPSEDLILRNLSHVLERQNPTNLRINAPRMRHGLHRASRDPVCSGGRVRGRGAVRDEAHRCRPRITAIVPLRHGEHLDEISAAHIRKRPRAGLGSPAPARTARASGGWRPRPRRRAAQTVGGARRRA